MADDTPQDTTLRPPTSRRRRGDPAGDDDNLGDPGKRALEAERAARKEAEKQAKAVQKELEQLRQAQMSESEKALAEAEARGKSAATTAFGQRLAAAEFVAEAARRNPTSTRPPCSRTSTSPSTSARTASPTPRASPPSSSAWCPRRQQQTGPKFGNADLGPAAPRRPPPTVRRAP
jgi:hypothetical protein